MLHINEIGSAIRCALIIKKKMTNLEKRLILNRIQCVQLIKIRIVCHVGFEIMTTYSANFILYQ